MCARHSSADDPPAEEVLNRGELLPPLTRADLHDVGRPHPVGNPGAEVAPDEISERLHPGYTSCAALTPPAVSALKARQTHQALHALLTNPDPFSTQHRLHSRTAIPAAAASMDLTDPLRQPCVGELTI
jgi:hypothetical protein